MSKKKKKGVTKGVAYWKKKVWKEAFSPYIRARDAIASDANAATGGIDWLICCTCGKRYPAFGIGCAQAGHFIPGRGNAILFDERGVHGQCYNCNINLKGNWPEYMRFMMDKYGRDVVDELLRLKKTVRKFTVIELQELYKKYKAEYEKFKEMEKKDRYEKNQEKNLRNGCTLF